MTEQRVAIKTDLGVEDTKIAVLHDDQWIDFQHRHVFFGECFVEDREEVHAVFARRAIEREGVTKLSRCGGGHAFRRIDWQSQNFFRRVMSDRLNVHAAFG